ncbi:MAG: hypothetical protein Q8P13_03025 [bacterium]|nr:hypothetical protein [bacterium]
MSEVATQTSSNLTREEIKEELGRFKQTIRLLWERYVSMKASHPECEKLIEEVFGELRDELMGDHTIEGGL